jgi:hypothetical protein
VPTIEDNDSVKDGGHGASAFAHPTHSFSAIKAFLFVKAADQLRV